MFEDVLSSLQRASSVLLFICFDIFMILQQEKTVTLSTTERISSPPLPTLIHRLCLCGFVSCVVKIGTPWKQLYRDRKAMKMK